MFQQVPLVEIDGMKLVQTKAILNYLAEKYNMHGKDLKDRVMYGLLFVYLFIRHNKDSPSCNWRIFIFIFIFLLLLFLFFRINMYSEGLMDLMEMIMVLPFNPDPTAKLEEIEKKAKERYFPVFEKVEKQNKMSCWW